MDQELQCRLGVINNPTSPAEQKRAAEAELSQFARSPDALSWAASTLGSSHQQDDHLLFFAARVLAGGARRWNSLSPAQQAGLRACVWARLVSQEKNRGRHFLINKLAAVAAHVACIDAAAYSEYLTQMQGCMEDMSSLSLGLTLLTTIMSELSTLAVSTPSGLSGQV
jgi:hypothetical protein